MRTKMAWTVGAIAVVGGATFGWLQFNRHQPAALGPGSYALQYAFGLDLRTAAGGQQRVSATIEGTLDVVERGAGERLARLKVGSLAVDEGARGLGFPVNAEAALGKPFSFAVAADGRVTAVRLATDLPLSVRSVLATVAHGTQYVLPSELDADEWTKTETDHNGSYRASYRYTSRREVEKTFKLGQDDSLGSVVGQARALFTLDGRRVTRVQLEETGGTFTGSASAPRSPFTLRVSLNRTGEADTSWVGAAEVPQGEPFTVQRSVPANLRVAGPTPRPRDELLGALATVPKEETLSEHNKLRNELTEAVIRDPAVGEALEKLLRLPEAGLGQRRHAVEALLGARTPQADQRAAALIGDRSVSSTVRIMLLGGATLLDNPGPGVVQAVRALMKSGEAPLNGQAAMAMGGIISGMQQKIEARQRANAQAAASVAGDPRADPAGVALRPQGTTRADRPLIKPTGTSAPTRPAPGTLERPDMTLPAGTADPPDTPPVDEPLPYPNPVAVDDPGSPGGPADPDPTEIDVMAEELLGMARQVLDPDPNAPHIPFAWKANALRALGNLGTAPCIPLVRKGLVDDNLLVRAAAVNALRFQDPAAVKEDLARAMRDPAMEVRTAAIKAARKMGPAATLDLLQNALFFDKSEHVRLQAVYTYGAWSHEAPALLAKLLEAAEHEKSPKVQQAIRAMTQKNRVEPPFVLEALPREQP